MRMFKRKPTPPEYQIDSFKARKPHINPYSGTYYKDMEALEMMWSVLQNLKIYDGDQAQAFEMSCKKNINLFHRMVDYDRGHGIEPPKYAPCYVRLAMLYEKQQRYEDAIEICVMAVQAGAYEDHSAGKMYGRLARMIRKSGLKVSPDIMKLAGGKGI